MIANAETVEKLLRARRAGMTLRLAAALAEVHVATVCRWQASDPVAAPLEETAALCPLATRLSAVQGPRRRPGRPRQAAILALRALAPVQLGELAAAGSAELQALWSPLLLVTQSEKYRLRLVRSANNSPLTAWRKRRQTGITWMKMDVFWSETGRIGPWNRLDRAKNGARLTHERRLHNRRKSLPING